MGPSSLRADRVDEVVSVSLEREARERDLRARYAAGERSYDVNNLRELVEGSRPPMRSHVAVLGLGEAGGDDRLRPRCGGCVVRGWDPVVTRRAVLCRAVGRCTRGDSRRRSCAEPDDGRPRGGGGVQRDARAFRHTGLRRPEHHAPVCAARRRRRRRAAGAAFADVALLAPRPRATACARRRSRRVTAPRGSPSSFARSGCPSRWWATSRETRPD